MTQARAGAVSRDGRESASGVPDRQEHERRVAIIKRLREILVRQREKFRSYLDVLDNESLAIHSGDTETLELQTRVEKNLVEDITALQKVIDPLQEMYRCGNSAPEADITGLGVELESLRRNVMQKNQENQFLLEQKMKILQTRIDTVRIPSGKRSVFAETPSASLVDIST
jgi:flagellar biosynthesis/type III secretory pathway chaperone